MSNYTHLTQHERYQILAFLQSGKSISSIATQVGRDKSTIYRELNRNKGLRGYRPQQAHEKAVYRLQNSHRHMVDSSRKCNSLHSCLKRVRGIL